MMEKTEEQGTCPSSSSSSSKWKKVVYGGMQPGFQDNHTDSSFLEAMVMNANVVKRDTWTAIRDSVAISQYVCVFLWWRVGDLLQSLPFYLYFFGMVFWQG